MVVVAALSTAIVASGLAESVAVQDLLDQERDLADAGGYILIVEPSPGDTVGLDASACERLREQADIRGSGSLLRSSLIGLESSPGSQVRLLAVSPGLINSVRMAGSPTGAGVAVGEGLSTEFGVTEGGAMALEVGSTGARSAPVVAVLEPGQLLEEANRGIVSVEIPRGTAERCFVSVEPSSYNRLREGEILGYATLSQSTPIVRDFVQRGSGRSLAVQYEQRFTSYVWVVAALFIFAMSTLVQRFRRSETALYRALSSTRLECFTIALMEYLVLLAIAAAIAVQSAIFFWRITDTDRPAILHGVYSMARLTLTGTFLQLFLIFLAVSSTRLLDALKDR